MSRRLPPLNALKAFEAAARHMSFTRAAEELFVTQAAVSHQIKGLEEFLGLKLFRRKNRSLLLTEQGQSYFQDIKEVFTQLTEATERVLASTAKGALTISLPPSFAIQWLVPRLNEFHMLHPDIDVRIKAVDRDEGSLSEDVDIAVYFGRGRWTGVVADKLHAELLVTVCSPQLFDQGIPLETPQDLKRHVLLHDIDRKDWKAWLKMMNIEGVNVNHGPIFSHTAMVLQAAVHSQGVALVNSVLAQPELLSGRLVCPFSEALTSQDSYYLVCEPSQADLGKIKAFRDWMLERVRKEQESIKRMTGANPVES
ncbi:transcriptional regulator GcvA [Neiella marina]|uniref:Transcriptional regulator GcvA n=1 Tax=Neiella marina TaxID=508461 RepID=A0A8J2U5J1_9GAMM|nr:transcriptional regulator GcvA [Neiella marina]GGA78904.1 transcriptional regulator GcvA [Neiella marina]